MEFRTQINIQKSPFDIGYGSRIMLLGSCFAQNIGRFLEENKFDININPFGILYNPMSISNVLNRLLDGKPFAEDEIVFHNGLYQSFMHHGDFSDTDKSECLKKINTSFEKAQQYLQSTDVLIITFGTSYVFKHRETENIVSNCHKFPASDFLRYRLSVEEIVDEWVSLLDVLKERNPEIKVVFTVSPIRHLKDGAHDNQLSKAVLLLAVEELMKKYSDVFYFPAYELMLDDLRDYRFYEEDMVHPNSTAVKYIWEAFSETWFNDETLIVIKEWQKIRSALRHRPLNGMTDAHKHFLRQTLLKLQTFKWKYPYFHCEKEMKFLEDQPE